MSLRAKLLAAIVLINLLVMGSLFYFLQSENARALTAAADQFRGAFTREVLRGLAERVTTPEATVDALLSYDAFDALCRDALVVVDPRSSDAAARPNRPGSPLPFVQVNPLGAVHRDVVAFPRERILEGIRFAIEHGRGVPVHNGICVPIETEAGRIIGGGWFVPQASVAPGVPTGRIVLAFGLGLLLLLGFTSIGLDRWVLGPLTELTRAARALEQGQLGKQAFVSDGAPELLDLVRTFNRASKQLATHEAELARAVDAATNRARRRERELVLSQRLAAIGTLAAGISHEINNPLAGMINAVQRLKKRDREEDRLYVELLDEGLQRVGEIVRRTLEFAPRTSKPVEFTMTEAVERARALAAHRLERSRVTFSLTREGEDRVLGDAHELTQVFLNLFLNSLDALDDALSAERRIDVAIGRGTDDEGVALVTVRVRDTGPGADQETLARIFDPFYSTKGATSTSDKLSSGLGMSISFSIVEQHGGAMRVSSPPGAGFIVDIELPAAGGAPPA